MSQTISIPELLERAFGVRPILLAQPRRVQPTGELELAVSGYREAYPASPMGTPVVSQIRFAPANDPDGRRFEGYTMSPTTMVKVRKGKNIVRTSVQGRDHTVKEYISQDDPVITFTGLIINLDSLDPPHEELRQLDDLFSFRPQLTVQCRYLNALGITALVIQDFQSEEIMGSPNVYKFQIRALGDLPEQLEAGQ